MDLIQYIAEMQQFTYDLYLVPDGKFGSKNKDGTWNGMIGEVLSGVSRFEYLPFCSLKGLQSVISFSKLYK